MLRYRQILRPEELIKDAQSILALVTNQNRDRMLCPDYYELLYNICKNLSKCPILYQNLISKRLISILVSLVTEIEDLALHVQNLGEMEKQNHLINLFEIYFYFLEHFLFFKNSEENNQGRTTSFFEPLSDWLAKELYSRNITTYLIEAMTLFQLITQSNMVLNLVNKQRDNKVLFVILNACFSGISDKKITRSRELKESIFKTLANCCCRFGQTEIVSRVLFNIICQREHAPPVIASFARFVFIEWKKLDVAHQLISEWEHFEFKTSYDVKLKKDSANVNIAHFISQVSNLLPEIVIHKIYVFKLHLACNAPVIRTEVISALGNAIKTISVNRESTYKQKMLSVMLQELLISRFHDNNCYSRTRVIHVWAKLVDEKVVSLTIWDRISELATTKVKDRSMLVRRASVKLLKEMVHNNPYGSKLSLPAFLNSSDDMSRFLARRKDSACIIPLKMSVHTGINLIQQIITGIIGIKHVIFAKYHTDFTISFDFIVTCIKHDLDTAGDTFEYMVGTLNDSMDEKVMLKMVTDGISAICLNSTCGIKHHSISKKVALNLIELLGGQKIILGKQIEKIIENAIISKTVVRTVFSETLEILNKMETSKMQTKTVKYSVHNRLLALDALFFCYIDLSIKYLGLILPKSLILRDSGTQKILNSMVKKLGRFLKLFETNRREYMFIPNKSSLTPKLIQQSLIITASSHFNKCMQLMATFVFAKLSSDVDARELSMVEAVVEGLYYLHPSPTQFFEELIAIASEKLYQPERVFRHKKFASLVISPLTGRICEEEFLLLERANTYIRESYFIGNFRRGSTMLWKQKNCEGFKIFAQFKDCLQCSIARKNGSIGKYGFFVGKMCHSRYFHKNPFSTRAFLIISLANLMAINKKYCLDNIALLFTLAKTEYNGNIRQLVLVKIGELVNRWPNLFDSWKWSMTCFLFDPNATIRRQTVRIISRLLVNELIKSKDYCVPLAYCVVDTDETVRALARCLFVHLADKNRRKCISFTEVILQIFRCHIMRREFRAIALFMMRFTVKAIDEEYLSRKPSPERTNEVAHQNAEGIFLLTSFHLLTDQSK
eukprot:gnl/MRDRNA2_/MRDRNA2_86472_c0_seq2.p1 gnl/MRDRNA2_/MRDRNA2_86472_c0~~gnl/MRDRNA2_/MRDRNA2_86472_c0_seq2.p1  ORF type:complete len:1068 (+),score=-47.16 gnl/MRDRNA2_/MRDRNA2_86472_c0_seq2:68-3271(+)